MILARALLFGLCLSAATARGGRRRAFKKTEDGTVAIYYVDEADYPTGLPEDFPDDFVIMPDYEAGDPLPGFPSIAPPGPEASPRARDDPTPDEEADSAPPAPVAPAPPPAPKPPQPPPAPKKAPAPAPPASAAASSGGDGAYGAAATPAPPPAAPAYPRRRVASARRSAAAKLAAAVRSQASGRRCGDLLGGCPFWASFLRGRQDPRNPRRRLRQDYCEASKADMHLYCRESCGLCGAASWGRRQRRRRVLRRRRRNH